MAKLYRDQVFRLHGIPRKIIHDRGPQFASKFMTKLYKLLGIEGNPSTAYHPQTDGQTERMNQEIEQYLRIFVNYKQSDWADWLALAEFSYNDKEQTSTKASPFFINYGLHPYKGTNPRYQSNNESAEQFAQRMQGAREEAQSALKKAAADMKKFYDRTRGEAIGYKPGDLVLLEATNLNTDRPMKKLDDKRYGPFEVLEKVGNSAYKLKLPPSMSRIHPVFNEVLLSPYHTPTFDSQSHITNPEPIIVDKEPEWEVEEIISSRFNRRRRQVEYLVHWKGYGPQERTWEPLENLANAQETLAEFIRQNPETQHTRKLEIEAIGTIALKGGVMS